MLAIPRTRRTPVPQQFKGCYAALLLTDNIQKSALLSVQYIGKILTIPGT